MQYMFSQFMQNPQVEHFHATRRVLHYLKGNPGLGILLRVDSNLQVCTYSNADWRACSLIRRSLTGYFVTLAGSSISWNTKKQSTVSHSSAEAAYHYVATTTSEQIWLKFLLANLGVFHTEKMKLLYNSQATMHITKNPSSHERTKHIQIDCHFVRERLIRRDSILSYLKTTEQLAYIFSKAFVTKQFLHLWDKLGLINPHPPT